MVTVSIDYALRPSKDAEFAELFGWVLESIDGFEGHKGSRLLKDPGRPDHFTFESRWEDRDQFETVFTSEAAHDLMGYCERELLVGPGTRRVEVSEPDWSAGTPPGSTGPSLAL